MIGWNAFAYDGSVRWYFTSGAGGAELYSCRICIDQHHSDLDLCLRYPYASIIVLIALLFYISHVSDDLCLQSQGYGEKY